MSQSQSLWKYVIPMKRLARSKSFLLSYTVFSIRLYSKKTDDYILKYSNVDVFHRENANKTIYK